MRDRIEARGGAFRRKAIAPRTMAAFCGSVAWMHCGDPSNLCASCLTDAVALNVEVARARGRAWVNELAAKSLGTEAWPTDSEVLMAIAYLKIQDLGRDSRLLNVLARELLDAARGGWPRHPVG